LSLSKRFRASCQRLCPFAFGVEVEVESFI
jgi:hypothetical protein